jgi:RNA recognition motif-containing protein
MGAKLYVGNLSFKTTEDNLRELFAKAGEVASVHLITDPHTGRIKGFGFVEMGSEADALKAIQMLNGTVFMERSLIVNEAKPQKPREQRGFGGGRGGRGGYGGGRGGGRGGR